MSKNKGPASVDLVIWAILGPTWNASGIQGVEFYKSLSQIIWKGLFFVEIWKENSLKIQNKRPYDTLWNCANSRVDEFLMMKFFQKIFIIFIHKRQFNMSSWLVRISNEAVSLVGLFAVKSDVFITSFKPCDLLKFSSSGRLVLSFGIKSRESSSNSLKDLDY